MKRAIILFVCAICATSCWSVSTYPEPVRTAYANHLYVGIETNLSNNAETMDMVLRLSDWCNAATDKEKIDIEDYYFRLYKVREAEGKISLSPISNEEKIEVTTRGEDIYTVGTSWTINYYDWTMNIECIAENQWLMTTDEMKYNSHDTALTFTKTASGIDYINYSLEGSGTIIETDSRCNIEYRIESPIAIKTGVIDVVMSYTDNATFSSGELLLAPESFDEAEYDARVKFINEHEYTLYYRGFAENYIDGYCLTEFYYE